MLHVDAGIPEKRLAAIVIFTVCQLCQSFISSRLSPPLQMTLVMDVARIIMYMQVHLLVIMDAPGSTLPCCTAHRQQLFCVHIWHKAHKNFDSLHICIHFVKRDDISKLQQIT